MSSYQFIDQPDGPGKVARQPKSEEAAPRKDAGPTASLIGQLQRTAGNEAVNALLRQYSVQRQTAALQREGAEEEELQMQRHSGEDALQREGEEDEEVQMQRQTASVQREGAEEEEMQMQRHTGMDALQREGEEEELQMQRQVASVQREEGSEAEDEEVQMQRQTAALQREGAEEEEVQMQRQTASIQREGAEEEEVQMQRQVAGSALQREGEEEEEVQAQRRAEGSKQVGLEGGALHPEVADRISAARGGGSALDEGTRTTMESAFGTSFADVRVHTGGESDEINRTVSAQAFTTGSDLFFRSGNYQPDTPGGQQLLAHELTHVVQQRAGVVGGGNGGGMHVTAAGDAHEQEADAMSAKVMQVQAQRKEEE